MQPSLLATKVQIPEYPYDFVSRERLIKTLEQGVTRHRLTVISAAAGSGKTTLLAHWAHTNETSVAWLSLNAEDDFLERFLRYLFAAWERIQPDIASSPLGILLGSRDPNREAVLSAFLNLATHSPANQIFVLDDYQLIQDPEIHKSLAFLLDHLPPQLHFVIGTRADPPLPLARYRARGQLFELGNEDLRFNLEEATLFLNHSADTDLPAQEIQRLLDRLEGWAAGLQLAALSLQHRNPASTGLATISGRQHFIADYLSQDVLNQLPADVSGFLLKTSILDRLSGPLCDAVTGTPGGQSMLERLERENLFVQALDDERIWFRYHPIFADFLRGELDRHHRNEGAELHRRAARWYLSQDLLEQSLRHAAAGDDVELVMQLGEHYFDIKLLSGEFTVLKRWLESLPAQWHSDYPLIGLAQASVFLFTGALEDGVRCIDKVEERLTLAVGEDTRWPLARVTAVRCTIACFQNNLTQAEAYAVKALHDLPKEDHTFLAAIHHALGDTYRRNGRWEEAQASYLKVLDFVHEPAFQIRSVHVFGALADLELQQGRLRASAAYWRKALTVIQKRETWGSFPLPFIGWVYIRMGEILYEWNEVKAAGDHLFQGLEQAELGGDVRAMVAGYLIAARLKLTEGDAEVATQYLERARPLLEQAPFPDWISSFERFQIELWLVQNRPGKAVHWADGILRSGVLESWPESEAKQLGMARVLIVKGDAPSLQESKLLLEHLIEVTELEGRKGVQMEALALQAIAYWSRGEQPSALISLERALRLAEPEGYTRLFADLGLPMARLLQVARSRVIMPEYVQKLLDALGVGASFLTPGGEVLPEPLTPREHEILELVAAGLTNDEIAERLSVSSETVKKHATSIYAKMGVHSRTQATARARELGLLK